MANESDVKLRVQPTPMAIPRDCPFKNDLLARKQQIVHLTELLSAVSGPCVIAVDGDWGTGKTTFIQLWEQYLRSSEFAVASFNAWDSDYCDDPFTALTEELLEGVEDVDNSSIADKVKKVREVASNVALLLIPQAIRLGIRTTTGLNLEFDETISNLLSSNGAERTSAYRTAKQFFEKFRCQLEELACEVGESHGGNPLIVFVDELDRCRPSYAIELLENAKHLFAVNHVVFVLSINRRELGNSVSALYGQRFDGSKYLTRFIDLEVRLAEPSRRDFIRAHLESLGIGDSLRVIARRGEFDDPSAVSGILFGFFGLPSLSVRTISQALHRLGVLLAVHGKTTQASALGSVVLLIIRTLDSTIYGQLLRREISDAEIRDRLFELVGRFDDPFNSAPALFEATLIVGIWEMGREHRRLDEKMHSPLIERYSKLVTSAAKSGEDSDIETMHARNVIDYARRMESRSVLGYVGFKDAAQLMDLLPVRR